MAAIGRENEGRLESVGKERGKVRGIAIEGAVEVKGADVLTKVVEGRGGVEVTKMWCNKWRKTWWVNGLPEGWIWERFGLHV
jgi:hypothetical protein